MRHGQSLANTSNRIVSSSIGHYGYGLTKLGHLDVAQSAQDALHANILTKHTCIVTSQFLRCKQTAQIVKKVLGSQQEILQLEDLNERYFGNCDLESSDSYEKVWELDSRDPASTVNNVESLIQVQSRITNAIIELESAILVPALILLVTHDDTACVLQASAQQTPLNGFRTYSMCPAEIRKLYFYHT